MRTVILLVTVAGCVNDPASTAAQQQSVARQGQGHERGGRHLASTHVQLAGGGTLELTAKVLDPDPIYLIIGGIKGETTSGGQSKDIEVRATASGPTGGTTLGTGVAAVTGVLANTVSPSYASGVGPSESVAIDFGAIEIPYHNQDPQTSNQIVAAGNAISILAGGSDAANAIQVLTPAFGLPSACGGANTCDRLQVTYDVVNAGKLGDRIALVVHDVATGAPVEGAEVTVCFAGAAGPETIVTDANGVAVSGARLGAQVSSVGVVATIGGQQLQCQKGATCQVTVP